MHASPFATVAPLVRGAAFIEAKVRKLERLRPLLRPELPRTETVDHFDFLSPELRERYRIVDTENVSAHPYDPHAATIIAACPADGLVLDCGAGFRGEDYRANVVNFEIVPYDTTDVLGVGEELPFRDASFDAVLSLNVLEHVQNPFRCATEITRVLRPGGRLYCVVPFLAALHGYPHHYYNMTHQGLANLFHGQLRVDRHLLLTSGLPIYTLTHLVQAWAAGLPPDAREEFLSLRLADLLREPAEYLTRPFVSGLPDEKNFELATTTGLLATKL